MSERDELLILKGEVAAAKIYLSQIRLLKAKVLRLETQIEVALNLDPTLEPVFSGGDSDD